MVTFVCFVQPSKLKTKVETQILLVIEPILSDAFNQIQETKVGSENQKSD